MLDCNRAQAQLNDFLDGVLNASQSVALMMHVEDCPSCKREYHAMKATQTLLQGAEVPGSENARERVLARFRHTVGAQTAPTPVRVWWRRPIPLGLTATTALALLGMLVILPFHNPGVLVQEPDTPGGMQSLALPSAVEIDNMTALHAVQSANILNDSAELNHQALADGNARLFLTTDETE